MKNKKTYLTIVVLLIISIMIWNVLNEPGIKDLKGNFKEVAYIRNEQNTGPVIRIYAVTVEGEPWKEMEQYGNYMPHNKYGNTRIFFFPANKSHPSKLVLGDENIPETMKENCLAIYEKDGMSQVNLRHYPYAKNR
ncbi:MAG: hypothetical protein H7069_13100 [Phormidesmis sp. FL-bin-119]|nr:hypothetical protein [Pedobacter sp.]